LLNPCWRGCDRKSPRSGTDDTYFHCSTLVGAGAIVKTHSPAPTTHIFMNVWRSFFVTRKLNTGQDRHGGAADTAALHYVLCNFPQITTPS
jgi:hypothetical protein